MPFPIEEKYIKETEADLKVVFPINYKKRMIKSNGGELVMDEFEFELYPFFDKSDRKRISRTCNHVGLETDNARQWRGFPENSIAIGSDGCSNQLVLAHNGDRILSEELYFWDHETRQIEKIAESIDKLHVAKPNNTAKDSFWLRVKSRFGM